MQVFYLYSKAVFPPLPLSFVSNPSPAGGRHFSELSSVGVTEEKSAVDLCCVSDSGRGSGAAAGLSGRSALCSLQTGRADIQKQGTGWRTNAFHLLHSPPPLPLELSLLLLIPRLPSTPSPAPFFFFTSIWTFQNDNNNLTPFFNPYSHVFPLFSSHITSPFESVFCKILKVYL